MLSNWMWRRRLSGRQCLLRDVAPMGQKISAKQLKTGEAEIRFRFADLPGSTHELSSSRSRT